MNRPAFRNWQTVQEEVLRRIHAREGKPGELIPNEAELAREFGCARATVNRALRSLADAGLLDRRRKAGTRIALQPVAKATIDISIIRHELEARGQKYGYQLLTRAVRTPPAQISGAMRSPASENMLHLRALHLADDHPYAVEDRWINTTTVPQALDEPFDQLSGNEWLLTNAPYTHGEIAFSAATAPDSDARLLSCPAKSAVFIIDRLTWDHGASVTKVRLTYAPGHQLRTAL